MYSLPLNTTSAINIHLMFQQQQQQQQMQQQLQESSSASTYVYSTNSGTAQQQQPVQVPVAVQMNPQPMQPLQINTDTQTQPDLMFEQHSLQMGAEPTAIDINQIQPQVSTSAEGHKRTVLVSVESEPDSARGSILDDSASVTSYGSRGSHGTAESLPDEFTRGITSLTLTSSSDDGIMMSPSDQQVFVLGRSVSLNESIDSRHSGGSRHSSHSPTTPVSPTTQNGDIDKHLKFQKNFPLAWDEEDNVSNISWGKNTDASSFILDDFTDDESRVVEDADALKTTRVALLKTEDITAMMKVKCSTEEMGYDLRVITLLQDILIRCDQLSRKMKGSAVRLTPFHLNKMKMPDGRPAKERAAEVARMLEGDLILCEAVLQKNAERLHITTDIRDPVYEKGPLVVGKIGMMVTLWKKHKYAVAQEFSDPLCNHIEFYRPHLLGNTTKVALKRKRKATDTVKHVFQARDLLSQMFKTDPTMTVAEAARRSFVEIIFYALYE